MMREQKRKSLDKENKKQKAKRNMQRNLMLLMLASFLIGVLCGKLVFAKDEPEVHPKEQIKIEKETLNFSDSEERININQFREEKEEEVPWNLVLVNATHFVEEGYEPELAEVENNYYVDKRIVRYLQQMLEDGRKEGLDFWICSAYRTIEKQTQLYENKVQRLMAEEGLSYAEAYEKAGNTVAYPGTSEHQLGLAVDIVAKDYQILDDKQANTDEAKWLEENCWKYGFILRYPLDKTEETGIIFEPWHYRYVGIEAAREIMEQGICLEEYL